MFAKILIVAACAFVAVAQAVNLQFTSTPANAVVGQPTTISWTGGDGSPVTITLRKGDPDNLSTISIITGSATGNSYTWTPSDLESGDDYALQISQGVDTTNYSGLFTISGGSSASTTVVAVAGSTTVPLTTLSPSPTANATTTSVSVTAVLTGASSSGTGSSLPRNTTFISQTLSSTSTGKTSATLASTTGGSSASSTASASGSASSTNAGAAFTANMGMGLGALAAAIFVL